MKKVITLLMCIAFVTSGSAQNDRINRGRSVKSVYENDRRYDNKNRERGRKDRGYKESRHSNFEKGRLVERVNRSYNLRIQQVNHDRSLSRREKKRMIKSLQAQRQYEIRRINAGQYGSNVYHDRRERKYEDKRNQQRRYAY